MLISRKLYRTRRFEVATNNGNDLDKLPKPDELAAEIIEILEANQISFREVLAGLETAS